MKKHIKSLISMILVLILLFSSSLYSYAFEVYSPTVVFYSPKLYKSASADLNVEDYFNKTEFIDYLVGELKTVDENTFNYNDYYGVIDISQFNIPYSVEIAKALNSYIWYESPELFRMSSLGYSYSSSTSGSTFSKIYFKGYYTKEQYSQMYDKMVQNADILLEDVKGNKKLSELEKALILHDRLALICEYDYQNYLNDSIPQSSFNAYGVFCLNTAVCMGYTLAYDYLLDKVGIKSVYCASDKLNHAWNIIYIDGKPYHTDVTWDDPTYDIPGQVTHDNFLLSTEKFKLSHTATDYSTLPADTTYDSFFWQKSSSQFIYHDKEDCFYYIDHDSKSINKVKNLNSLSDDSEEILDLSSYSWSAGQNSFWNDNYSQLAEIKDRIFYSTPNVVFELNTETYMSLPILSPDYTENSYYGIFGLRASGCYITAFSSNNPQKVNSGTIVTCVCHTPDDNWTVTKQPTLYETGTKSLLCKYCRETIETMEIEPSVISIKDDNTAIDFDKRAIFTELNAATLINEIVNISTDITYTVTPSLIADKHSFIGTGSVIELFKDGEKFDEYTVIINGDLNGDSVTDVLDIAFTEMCLSGNIKPNMEQCFASNGYTKAELDTNSYSYVVNKALSATG